MTLNHEEWVQKLKKLGLSGYEAQVYLALLGETRAPASRIVRKSRVPQSKVYGALDSLVDRGFAEQILGDVKLYRGIPPVDAFAHYRRRVEASLSDAEGAMTELAGLAPDSPGEDPSSLGIRLVRSAQVPRVFTESIENARSEIYVSIKAPLIVAADTEGDERIQGRGVDLRYLIETAALRDPAHGVGLAENVQRVNCVRFIEQVPLRYVLLDRQIIMIELLENDGSSMGLIIPNEGLVENMRTMFLGLWDQARAFADLPDSQRLAATEPG